MKCCDVGQLMAISQRERQRVSELGKGDLVHDEEISVDEVQICPGV